MGDNSYVKGSLTKHLHCFCPIRVLIFDVESGVEVSIQGPISSVQSDLEALAIQKLKYVLKQRAKAAKGKEKTKLGGKGLIV